MSFFLYILLIFKQLEENRKVTLFGYTFGYTFCKKNLKSVTEKGKNRGYSYGLVSGTLFFRVFGNIHKSVTICIIGC